MADKLFRKMGAFVILAAILLSGCSQIEANPEATVPVPLATENSLHECTAETDTGYYSLNIVFENQANITYIDYASRKEIFLCEQPGCLHQTDVCRSCIFLDESLTIPALFVVNDSLLLLQTGSSVTKPANIEIANKDGSERRLLAQFPSNYVLFQPVYTDQKALYLMAEQIDEETGISIKKILSVALADGTIRELYDYPKNVPTPYIAGVLDQNLILATLLTDPDGRMFQEYRIFDVETGAMADQALALFDVSEEGSFVKGDRLYAVAYAEQKVRITDLRTHTVTEVDYAPIMQSLEKSAENNVVSVFALGETLLRIEVPSAEPAQDGFYNFLLDIKSGEYRPFTLLKEYNQDVITILGSYEDYFLVLKDWIMSSQTDQKGVPSMIFMPQYAFIAKEDFRSSVPQYIPIESDVYPSVWSV